MSHDKPSADGDAAFLDQIETFQGKRPFMVLPEGLTAEDISALSLVMLELARQRTAERHTAGGEYLTHAGYSRRGDFSAGCPSDSWPWDAEHWKPKTPIRDATRGCALGVAGIAHRLRHGERAEGLTMGSNDPRAIYDGTNRGQRELLVMIQVEVGDPKATKRSIAVLYALCIAAFQFSDETAWQAINGHIRERFDFKQGDAIKTLAWSIYEATATELKRRAAALEREVGHA